MNIGHAANADLMPSPRLIAFGKRWETLRLIAYDDATGLPVPAGGSARGVLTIGYGHTGADVRPGQSITENQADDFYARDLGRAAREVKQLVAVPLTQDQFDALCDFEFNSGGLELIDKQGRPQPSTLLSLLNAKDYIGACAELARWHVDGGKRLGGLLDRCIDRMRLFRGTPSRL